MKSQAIPDRFQRIIDRVEAHDNGWFLANPDQRMFVRDTVPGEFGNDPVSDITVVMRFQHALARIAMQGAIPPGAKQMTLEASGLELRMPVVRLFGFK